MIKYEYRFHYNGITILTNPPLYIYTVDENAGSHLMQCLLVAVQHGNAALIKDALPSNSSFLYFSPLPCGLFR